MRADAPAPPDADGEPDLSPSGLETSPFAGGPGKSPVFSSRAVRDATVVTGAIESLTRFVDGQDVLDDLAWRLESLTADQVNFLQLSAEPGLVQRAQARSEVLKGAKAAALRKLLTDLAGGAIPEPVNRANLLAPTGPILPPLASLQPRASGAAEAGATPATPSLGPANPAPPAPGAPSLTTAPPLASRPIPPAPARPAFAPPVPPPRQAAPAPAPVATPVAAPIPTVSVTLQPLSVATPEAPATEPVRDVAVPKADIRPVEVAPPAPALVRATTPEPSPKPVEQPKAPPKVPEPEAPKPKSPEPLKAAEPPRHAPLAEPPRPPPAPEPAAPSVPRLGRQDAEARRARLMASLNDTLSSSEAAQ